MKALLVIIAAIYAAGSLAVGVVSYEASQSNAQKIERLQTDTNDNLCNQSAYQGGVSCQGGDGNGVTGLVP